MLCWSLPAERSFIGMLEQEGADYYLMPLRYAALITARKLCPPERILSFSQLISTDERRQLSEDAFDYNNKFRKQVRRVRREPWLVAAAAEVSYYVIYYAMLWESVLARIHARFPHARLHLYEPFSMASLDIACRWDHAVLSEMFPRMLVADNAPRTSGKNDIRKLLRSLAVQAGKWINRFPGPFSISPDWIDSKTAPCSLVVCGLQGSYRVWQTTLVRRLQAAGLKDFRWLVNRKAGFRLADHETAGDSDKDLEPVMESVSDAETTGTWKSRWLARAAEIQVIERLRTALQSHPFARKYRHVADVVAVVMSRFEPNLALRYRTCERMMRRLDPGVVVSNAYFGIMSLVREWARKHRRVYVRLQHGIEFYSRADYIWDADISGVMGEASALEIAKANSKIRDTIRVVGGLHFSEQALRSVGEQIHGGTPTRKAALLLAPGWNHNLVETEDEVEEEWAELAGQLSRIGYQLAFRPHRNPTGNYYEKEMLEAGPASLRGVYMADPYESLMEQLADYPVAIVTYWSGAAILALYAGIPLVGWLPRPGFKDSDQIIKGLPLWGCRATELVDLLQKLESDSDFRKSKLSEQKAFLEKQISNPYGDPYARAVEVIMNTQAGK